jgi:hypothetical protein
MHCKKAFVGSFKTSFKHLGNQRGDAFVVAMVIVGISVVSSLLMMTYSMQIISGSKSPRMKSMMTSMEAKVRAVLLTPATYTKCGCPTVAKRSNFNLKVNEVTQLSRVIPGVQCPSSKPACGISVAMLKPFNPSLIVSGGQLVSRAEVRISYEGTDFPLKPIDVVVDVPADILQLSGIYQCPAAKPKFNGFLPDGSINCEALPSKLGPNQFMVSVDPAGLGTTPGTFPSADLSCSPDQFFDSVKWTDGGNSIYSHCAPRGNPFDVFGFAPKPFPSGDVVFTPSL